MGLDYIIKNSLILSFCLIGAGCSEGDKLCERDVTVKINNNNKLVEIEVDGPFVLERSEVSEMFDRKKIRVNDKIFDFEYSYLNREFKIIKSGLGDKSVGRVMVEFYD